MTDDELKQIEARWSGGAQVRMGRRLVGDGFDVSVPYAGDVLTLAAEVRRLREENGRLRDLLSLVGPEALRRVRAALSAGGRPRRGD